METINSIARLMLLLLNRNNEGKEQPYNIEILTDRPPLFKIYEPWHDISNSEVCAISKGSDQPSHTRRLIRTFASRLNILLNVKILTKHHLESLSLKGGYTGSSESTLVKMPYCWKSHTVAELYWTIQNTCINCIIEIEWSTSQERVEKDRTCSI